MGRVLFVAAQPVELDGGRCRRRVCRRRGRCRMLLPGGDRGKKVRKRGRKVVVREEEGERIVPEGVKGVGEMESRGLLLGEAEKVREEKTEEGTGEQPQDGQDGRRWRWVWGAIQWMLRFVPGMRRRSKGGRRESGSTLQNEKDNQLSDVDRTEMMQLDKIARIADGDERGMSSQEQVENIVEARTGDEKNKQDLLDSTTDTDGERQPKPRGFFSFGRRNKQKPKSQKKEKLPVFFSFGDMREERVYNLTRQATKRHARVSQGVRDELATLLPYDLQRTLFDELLALSQGQGKQTRADSKTKSRKKGDSRESSGSSRARLKSVDAIHDQSSEILVQLRKDLEELDNDKENVLNASGGSKKKEDSKENKVPLLRIPGRFLGGFLQLVRFPRSDGSKDEQDTAGKVTSRQVTAYAIALSREMESTDEADLSSGAASAFAAASAIASSATNSQREVAEAAGLNASVSAARAVRSVEDATVFVETVGVGPLVTAVRVLRGSNHAAALTALANLAIILPSSRVKILRADDASIGQSIIHAIERFVGLRILPGDRQLWHMEALVSGTHLLGSLALAPGKVGRNWRRQTAIDEALIRNLKKLAGGLKPDEPEGAARAARRALGILGKNEWKPRLEGQRGLRILSIDGGGTRAVMSFEMLKVLKRLTGCEVHEMFDVIGGTSTGAIVAASLGITHKTVEEVESLYRDLIGKVFAKHPVNGPKMLLTRAFYDTNVLEESLKQECGRGVLIDSLAEDGMNKVFMVSSIMSKSPQEPHLFRNYTYPLGKESRYEGTSEAKLWEALRASSAAPTFFSEIRINDELHADGAIVANNPAAVAVHEAKCIYPGVPIELLVSMGNGQAPSAAETTTAVDDVDSGVSESGRVKSVGWGEVVGSIVASATSTENVHHALLDLFPSDKYFRFNPTTQSTQIDETRPGKLRFFVEEAQAYIAMERERFERVAEILRPKERKNLWRRFRDSVMSEIAFWESGVDDGKDLFFPY